MKLNLIYSYGDGFEVAQYREKAIPIQIQVCSFVLPINGNGNWSLNSQIERERGQRKDCVFVFVCGSDASQLNNFNKLNSGIWNLET